MALGLDPRCKSQLVDAFRKILPQIKVINNTYLDYESVAGLDNLDKILPDCGGIHNTINKYIGDAPLSTFIFKTIDRELAENLEYKQEVGSRPLTSLLNYSNLETTASRLIDEFDSLPFDYLVSFEFPPPLGESLRKEINKPFPLNNTMRIIPPDDQYNLIYPLNTGKKGIDLELFDSYWVLENLGDQETRKWNQNAVYLQIDVSGFVGGYSLTSPIVEIIMILKSFFALLIALGFISVKRRHFVRPRVRHLIIHRRLSDQWKISKTQKLAMDFAEVLDNLELNESPKEDGKNTQWIQTSLSFLKIIFSSSIERNERLLKASQWLMDSYMGNNELLAFVQAMIAIEVLLGCKEPKEISIGELLSSRCAYLIGKNHDDRDEVLRMLKKIYDIRSDIVHRGKNTLSAGEKELFYHLRWLCSRVILEELQLLIADKK